MTKPEAHVLVIWHSSFLRHSCLDIRHSEMIARNGHFPMLDPQFIRDNLQAVKTNCQNRAVTADVDRVVALDDQRKELLQKTQVLQQRQNEISKQIPKE